MIKNPMPIMRIRPLFLLVLLVLTSPAYAIPPPDVIASVWQSVLQVIGVAAVFITGAVYALRQWLEHYLGRWQKPVLYSLLIIAVLAVLALFLWPSAARAETAQSIVPKPLAIEDIIKQEEDEWLRDWKLQTLAEMKQEANLTRQRKRLPPVKFAKVGSFTPDALQQLLEQRPNDIYLLDIREGSERSKFRIRHHGEFRYGDLVQNVLPADLPADKVIVVLCHSGLRGYLGAYLLQQAGFKQVTFLRGGLAKWYEEGLAVVGKEDFKAKKRRLLTKREARRFAAIKVQVDANGTAPVALRNLVQLSYETASSADLQRVLQSIKTEPYLMVCKTYGGCFHATNMAWLIEQRGGKVLGIYDETGKHARYIQK